jgi:hypothetical protein
MKRHDYIPMLSNQRLMALVMASVFSVAVNAAAPSLVVNVVIDGLKQEYIDVLRDQLGPDGFNRLMRDGVLLENVDFGTPLDRDAATAMLMTGAAPSTNGVSSGKVYDKTTRREVSAFADNLYIGNYTNEPYSPRRLRVTTIADEARIAGAGITLSYSIAPDAEQAIILAGHAANGAVWIDDNTANWASSTFYKDFPTPAAASNRMNPLKARLDTISWSPSPEAAKCGILPEHLTRYPFRYVFRTGDNAERIAAFKASPLVNNQVTDLATDYITSLNLGQHGGTDMLNIGLTLKPYEYSKTAENRYELIDSYVKVDACIARLLKTLEQRLGNDKFMLNILGLPERPNRRRDDEKWGLPSGEFSSRKAVSLLNLYLTAIHGNGEWVEAYSNGSFYLNSQLAKDRQKDPAILRAQAADFLARMSGVERAYTIDAVRDGSAPTTNPIALRLNTVINDTGDVFIEITPGWSLVDDFNLAKHRSVDVAAKAMPTSMALMLVPSTKPQIISSPVDARILAPTVARQMHIRSPNGATESPLRFH